MKNEKYQAPLNIYISSSYDDAELAQKFLSDYVKGFGITVDKQRNGDELYVTIDGLDEDIDALVSVYTAQYDEFKKDCKAEPSGWVSPVNFEKSKEDESMKSESNIEDLRDQTISWGTMRSEDLIPKFLGVLKTYAKDKYDEYVNENPEVLDIDGLDDETLGWIVDELFDELDKIAPEGTYFGAHPDDGADYGFWSVEESKQREAKNSEAQCYTLWATFGKNNNVYYAADEKGDSWNDDPEEAYEFPTRAAAKKAVNSFVDTLNSGVGDHFNWTANKVFITPQSGKSESKKSEAYEDIWRGAKVMTGTEAYEQLDYVKEIEDDIISEYGEDYYEDPDAVDEYNQRLHDYIDSCFYQDFVSINGEEIPLGISRDPKLLIVLTDNTNYGDKAVELVKKLANGELTGSSEDGDYVAIMDGVHGSPHFDIYSEEPKSEGKSDKDGKDDKDCKGKGCNGSDEKCGGDKKKEDRGKPQEGSSASNNWVAYYFCKDPQGLEWAVLPHTVSMIGNVNCVNARGGMESIGKEYVLSKCTPVEDVESSEIWKAVCDGEDRKVVAIDRNDAERVLRAENGLEELKSVVAGKDESKKNEADATFKVGDFVNYDAESDGKDVYDSFIPCEVVDVNDDGTLGLCVYGSYVDEEGLGENASASCCSKLDHYAGMVDANHYYMGGKYNAYKGGWEILITDKELNPKVYEFIGTIDDLSEVIDIDDFYGGENFVFDEDLKDEVANNTGWDVETTTFADMTGDVEESKKSEASPDVATIEGLKSLLGQGVAVADNELRCKGVWKLNSKNPKQHQWTFVGDNGSISIKTDDDFKVIRIWGDLNKKSFDLDVSENKEEAKKSESLTLKQAELKKMAKYGEAEDITGLSDAEAKELKKSGVELVGISRGTYGMNGALMRGTADGKLYVITSRNSNLFYFV